MLTHIGEKPSQRKPHRYKCCISSNYRANTAFNQNSLGEVTTKRTTFFTHVQKISNKVEGNEPGFADLLPVAGTHQLSAAAGKRLKAEVPSGELMGHVEAINLHNLVIKQLRIQIRQEILNRCERKSSFCSSF